MYVQSKDITTEPDDGCDDMKILLTGSSGFIGQHIDAALIAAGHEVMQASRCNGMDFNRMVQVSDWLPHLQHVDVVINCVGIIVETRQQQFINLHTAAPSALFRACEQAGVSRVIQISALGADEDAFTPYQLSKKAADDVLRSLALDWFILRPSLVYGEGGASTRFFRSLAKLPVLPLVSGGVQQIQPVHIYDVVDVVLACLTAKKTRQTIDITGPQAMSFADWIQRFRHKIDKTPSFIIPVPYRLMVEMAHVFHFIFPLLHPDNLRMLQQGNTASNISMLQILGRAPRDLP